jgi:hypothetical protein
LGDAKFNPAAAPVQPALKGPSVSSTNPLGGSLPSAAEADAEATRQAKAFADQVEQQGAGQLPNLPKPVVPGLNG